MTSGCKGFRGRLLLSAGVLGIVAFASSAVAQIETVTVSAQRIEQNIQDVPIAVTAFTGGDLQNQHITSVSQLSALTPNVNFEAGAPFSGDSSVLSASIRGIGQDDFAFNLDPGVGVYLDGVYLARTIGANVDLMDIQRIEVLKGPQGTLFGRNTIGGAINIVTRDPGSDYSMQVQVTTGSYNRRDVAGYMDLPFSDNFRTSIAFASNIRDGYQEIIPYKNVNHYIMEPYALGGGTDTHSDFGGQNKQAARIKAIWEMSETFTATLSADWAHQDQSSVPNTVLAVYPDPRLGPPGGVFAEWYNLCVNGIMVGRLCDTPRATGWPIGPHGLPAITDYPVGSLIPINSDTTQTGDIDTTYANGPNFAKYDVVGVSLTLEQQLNDMMTLKSITGYRNIHWNIGIPLDGSPNHGNFLTVVDKQRQEQWSEELQILGKGLGDRLTYVAGLYYFWEAGFVHDWVPFTGGFLSVQDSGLNNIETTSYAAYFHVDYMVTDRIGLTVGARYSVDRKRFEGGQQDLNGLTYKISGCYPPTDNANLHLDPMIPDGVTCQMALGFPIASEPFRYFPAGWNKQNFYLFTPTLGVQYHVSDDIMTYFSWSKGFKSGGWTTRLSAPILDASDAEYKPEKAQTYELGFKSELFDHRVVLNAAIFYTDYEDMQLNEQVGASPVLSNLGSAEIRGAEVEMVADLGKGFLLRANLGYIDAEYVEVSPLTAGTITLDSKLPKTPEWKFILSPQYTHTLANGNELLFLATYTYTSSLYNDSLNTELLKRPSVHMLDASVHYIFNDGKYDVALGGTNLFDERYLTIGSVNYAAGFVDGTYSRPAEWYLSLTAKF